jgi:hypothetical protein
VVDPNAAWLGFRTCGEARDVVEEACVASGVGRLDHRQLEGARGVVENNKTEQKDGVAFV